MFEPTFGCNNHVQWQTMTGYENKGSTVCFMPMFGLSFILAENQGRNTFQPLVIRGKMFVGKSNMSRAASMFQPNLALNHFISFVVVHF